MSSKDIAIKVENISKCYRIGLKEETYEHLSSSIINFLKSPLKNYRKYRSLYKFDDITFDSGSVSGSTPSDIIWALRDVSFELRRGEVLGVIGRNGAGKSTLLKILSRIAYPASGCIQIRGRVSSLLEVGTGFHPELTGRDNVYLNGTVLGMTKKEVSKKFDEIVAFSGVEKFIDTPVKRYSSGMQVRLAFAVAAHLEPEILIVDEVLAVGDVAFQKKCLGKMTEVARTGRTILFVSHNMGAIENLCTRGIWLDDGRVVMDGDVGVATSSYLKSTNIDSSETAPEFWKHNGTGEAFIMDAYLLDGGGKECSTFKMGETLFVEFCVEFNKSFQAIDDIAVEVMQVNTGLRVLHLLCQDCGFYLENVTSGKRRFQVEIPNCLLYPGHYQISIYVGDGSSAGFDYVNNVLKFTMVQSRVSKRTNPFHSTHAIYHNQSIWKEI